MDTSSMKNSNNSEKEKVSQDLYCPASVAQLAECCAVHPKYCRFDSRSVHLPGLQFDPQLESILKTTN